MNYVDYTLVRLATPSLRASLFDQVSLGQFIAAAYDAEAMTFNGPYTAIFEKLFIGVSVPRFSLVEGSWSSPLPAERNEARLAIHGIGTETELVDAFWRGAVVAQTSMQTAAVNRVDGSWIDTSGIDAEIIAALGALPNSPAELEAQRRLRLLQRIGTKFTQPETLTARWLEGWLAQLGVGSVGELMQRAGAQGLGAFHVGFSAPSSAPSASRALPLAVALLIRGWPFSVSRLLADSKRARDHLDQQGLGRPHLSGSNERLPLLVAWVIPDAAFDDPDWPGGEAGGLNPEQRRQLRRAAAGQWLAQEGIGLVVTPAH